MALGLKPSSAAVWARVLAVALDAGLATEAAPATAALAGVAFLLAVALAFQRLCWIVSYAHCDFCLYSRLSDGAQQNQAATLVSFSGPLDRHKIRLRPSCIYTDPCAMAKFAILFVCTDNLCRSPTAEVVFRHMAMQQGFADQFHVESAATHDFNAGEPVDIRAQKHAIRRDYDLSKFRARLVQSDDFERFDLILAMEESNLLDLRLRCAPKYTDKLHFLTEYCQDLIPQDIPDPFYGEPNEFEYVLDRVEDAIGGLLRSFEGLYRNR